MMMMFPSTGGGPISSTSFESFEYSESESSGEEDILEYERINRLSFLTVSTVDENLMEEHGYSDSELQQEDHDYERDSSRGQTCGFLHRCSVLWSQLTKSEISGSLGDLGTFISLFVALGRKQAIHVGPALFLAGLSNALTGYFWDVPMPIQPMKSIATVAVIDVLSREQVTTAGLCMGIVLIALSLTNGIEWVNRLVPISVVSGVQVGVGMSLAIHGIQMMADLNWIDKLDCRLLALFSALACLYFLREDYAAGAEDEERHDSSTALRQRQRPRRKPSPVGLYLFGIATVIAVTNLTRAGDLKWSVAPIVTWTLRGLTWKDWGIGLWEGAFPQLPLTTLNSVISVCCLAHALYPEKRKSGHTGSDGVLSRREVSMSVGCMNLLLCPFGAMPSCHGAGGLAGQHKFGARHGASVVFLGFNKMIIAVFLGSLILPFLDEFPASILGVMLTFSGQELASTGITALVQASQESSPNHVGQTLRTNAAIAVITAAVIVGLKKTHYGAVAGWVAHMIYGKGMEEFSSCQERRNATEYAPVDQLTLGETEETMSSESDQPA